MNDNRPRTALTASKNLEPASRHRPNVRLGSRQQSQMLVGRCNDRQAGLGKDGVEAGPESGASCRIR
jgi:hypothetical protein